MRPTTRSRVGVTRPMCLGFGACWLTAWWISTGYVPAWWQQGWPRTHVGSVAEAEILAPLADLLMPGTPIGELFRSFPAPEGWGGSSLQPDLAAYGVLRNKDAALFVEYDGYWRHGEKAGVARDEAKNEALLSFAPTGSLVIRISHTRQRGLKGSVVWIHVDSWHSGDRKSISNSLKVVLEKAFDVVGNLLHPPAAKRLQREVQLDMFHISGLALDFISNARVCGNGNTTQEISQYLINMGFSIQQTDLMLRAGLNGKCIPGTIEPKTRWLVTLGLTKGQVAKVVAGFPQMLGLSIKQNLEPTVGWLMAVGLTKGQVAKVVAGSPRMLGYSIKQNLEPTVGWLMAVGLTKGQVAKVVAGSPRMLGYSIKQNLEPTVGWLMAVGLTKGQVAKVVAGFPQMLGLSIKQNLEPTVGWLMAVGLTKGQVASAVAIKPQLFGYSIEKNLEPTVGWLMAVGLTKGQVAKVVAGFPSVLGLSIKQNLELTVGWLMAVGLTKGQVAKVVAGFPSVLGYSIKQNLEPTVGWLMAVGLTKGQVASAVAIKPQLFGYSIEKNMKPKWKLLLGIFDAEEASNLIARRPTVLGYSMVRVAERIKILAKLNITSKLASVIDLPDVKFRTRFFV